MAAALTFAHLLSFQVSYMSLPLGSALSSSAATIGSKLLVDATSLALGFVKKTLGGGDISSDVVLKRGILEVNFSTGSLSLANKDQPIVSQEFRALKRKYAGEGDLLISLQFQGNESWDITTQCNDEKRTIGHLLECILHRLSLEQTIEAGQAKGVLGFDKTVIKAGLLKRKAKTIYKVDERFIVLIPGKLLLFKGPNISSQRVRYVTTLARARVEILVPHTKALSLSASSADAAQEWILALEDAIEYANSQGAGTQTMQRDVGKAQMAYHGEAQTGERYQNMHLNGFQVLKPGDRAAMFSTLQRPANQSVEQSDVQHVAGDQDFTARQKDERRGPEAWNCMMGVETGLAAGDPRTEANRAKSPEYKAAASYGGSCRAQVASCRKIDGLAWGGPSTMAFAVSHIPTSGFSQCENSLGRTGANILTQEVLRADSSSPDGVTGGPVKDEPNNLTYVFADAGGVPSANKPLENFQTYMQIGRSQYLDQQDSSMMSPVANVSLNQPDTPYFYQPFVESYGNQEASIMRPGNSPAYGQDNAYRDQHINLQRALKANDPHVSQQIDAYERPQSHHLDVPNANSPFMDWQLQRYLNHDAPRPPNADNSFLNQHNSPLKDNAFRLPATITMDRYMTNQSSCFRDGQNSSAMSAPITREYLDRPNNQQQISASRAAGNQPLLNVRYPSTEPLMRGNFYDRAQDGAATCSVNQTLSTSVGGFCTLTNPGQSDSSRRCEMVGQNICDTSHRPPYASQAGRQPFPQL